MPTGIKIYKTKDFVRRTESGEINLEKSLDLVHDLTVAAGFHSDHNILIDLRGTWGGLNATELTEPL